MDLKNKLALSDQFPYCVSPKRRVISGFGLGVVGSFIFLSVLFYNASFKATFLKPVFQGFNSFGANNSTHFLSWPFSFSTTSALKSSSTSTNDSSSPAVTTVELQNSMDLMRRSGEGKLMDETHEANASEIGTSGKKLDSTGQGMAMENTREGKSSEKVNNGSFVVAEETHRVNGPEINKNVKSSNSSGKGIVQENNPYSHYHSQHKEAQGGFHGKCDIFDGRWVRDDTKPYYPGGSCPYIDTDFDCHLNRRPDDEFLRWKWQPFGCDIPSLNATDFLERLRGKKLVFVGDSLNRNMWESLVCILHHSVRNKKRVYEISGRTEFKKKGFYAFRFEDYNCSVDFVSSPFLVRESSFKGRNGSFETLRLDLMDRTTSMYHDADVVIFNTGHWWTHEKTSRGEDYYQEGNHVYPRLKVLEAYKRALTTWARWVDRNFEGNRTRVIFRGYSVTHFRGGLWNSGGQCHKEAEPIFNKSYLPKYPSKMRALEHVLQEMRTPVIYLNISRLTGYRKDGHPSIYRKEYKSVEEQIAAEHSQDCSHWCLPGVPDTWNELLYASLLQTGTGSWRS